MATRFEIVLHGSDPVALRAAGEAALDEIERIENLLSLYRNTSEIAHVNARAASEPVRVSPAVFRLLEQARQLSELTGGAFDVTIAPLVRCWGFLGGTGRLPDPAAVAEARANVGFALVELNRTDSAVRFSRQGVMLDLGALGKGYAIERAVEVVRDAGVTSAILHGGTSTVYALGAPPDSASWQVAIQRPVPGASAPADSPQSSAGPPGARPELAEGAVQHMARSASPSDLLTIVPLRDEALSVSAVWGRSFQVAGRTYGHVIDPRTGQPVEHSLLSAVVLPSATETDALSTALLTLGAAWIPTLAALRPGVRALVAGAGPGEHQVEARGIALQL